MTVSDTASPVKSTRGRKAGVPPKERKPIPANEFVVTIPNEGTRATFKRRREERNPQQLQVDALIAEVHKDWIKAGKPSNWIDMPSRVWPVSKTHSDDAQFMLRKACAFYGRRLFTGQVDDEPTKCKDENCPCHRAPQGLIHIPFCVMDAREKKARKMTVEQLFEFAEEMGISAEDIVAWLG